MSRLNLLLLPLFVMFAACNGDKDETDTGGTDTDATDTDTTDTDPTGGDNEVSVDVTAADGGTVEVGAATLEIPPGSLEADTTITARGVAPDASLPEYDTVVGLVYEFGPDGTTFDPAATLTLPLAEVPGAGEAAVMSWLDVSSNTWVDLPSTVTGTTVSAPVEHFTSFVVRIVVGDPTVGGECAFDGACGGDVLGTWTLEGVCLLETYTETTGSGVPCATVEIDLDMTGTFEFLADNTYTAETRITGEIRSVLVDECLDGLSDCSQFEDDATTCTGDVAVSCTCTAPIDIPDSATGQWQTNGDMLTLDERETGGDPDEGPEDSEYCVDGDTLQIYDPVEGTVVTGTR